MPDGFGHPVMTALAVCIPWESDNSEGLMKQDSQIERRGLLWRRWGEPLVMGELQLRALAGFIEPRQVALCWVNFLKGNWCTVVLAGGKKETGFLGSSALGPCWWGNAMRSWLTGHVLPSLFIFLPSLLTGGYMESFAFFFFFFAKSALLLIN